MKILRTVNLGANFTCSYKKEFNILLTRNLPIEFDIAQ